MATSNFKLGKYVDRTLILVVKQEHYDVQTDGCLRINNIAMVAVWKSVKLFCNNIKFHPKKQMLTIGKQSKM